MKKIMTTGVVLMVQSSVELSCQMEVLEITDVNSCRLKM